MAIFRSPGWALPDFSTIMEDFDRTRRQMDRLLSAFTGAGAPPVVSGVFPPIVLKEDGDSFVIEAEVPGISAEDINISVHGRTLTLSGQRRPMEPENVNYHRRERKWGSFSKALTLPDEVNSDGVRAECKNGILKILLPKSEQVKPKKIAIKSE